MKHLKALRLLFAKHGELWVYPCIVLVVILMASWNPENGNPIAEWDFQALKFVVIVMVILVVFLTYLLTKLIITYILDIWGSYKDILKDLK